MPEIVHDERPTLVLNRTFKTGGVQRDAERPPQSLTDYADRTAAKGIWTKAVDR